MSSTYENGGYNLTHCWSLMQTEHCPALRWYVCGYGKWSKSGFAVVDDFGTLVPVN